MIVMGVDPGLARVGIGVVRGGAGPAVPLGYECITSSGKDRTASERLAGIYDRLVALFDRFSPDELAVDDRHDVRRVEGCDRRVLFGDGHERPARGGSGLLRCSRRRLPRRRRRWKGCKRIRERLRHHWRGAAQGSEREQTSLQDSSSINNRRSCHANDLSNGRLIR